MAGPPKKLNAVNYAAFLLRLSRPGFAWLADGLLPVSPGLLSLWGGSKSLWELQG
jgi:hypothetical protein